MWTHYGWYPRPFWAALLFLALALAILFAEPLGLILGTFLWRWGLPLTLGAMVVLLALATLRETR